MICDTVRVRPKHMERLSGDCRVSKPDFQALEKLTHRSSKGMGPLAKRAGMGGTLAVGGRSVISGIIAG